MFDKYIDILFDQLQDNEKQQLPKEFLKTTVIKDNKNSKERQIYDILIGKLSSKGVEELEKRLLNLNKQYKLNSVIDQIYKYRPKEDEQTILSFLDRPESYFQGKLFQLNDPKGNQSTYSEITSCKRFQEDNKLFLQISLENGANIYLNYKNDQILGVYTSYKRKVKLMDLFEYIKQKEQQNLEGSLEFSKQKEELNDSKCRIELGNYILRCEGLKKCSALQKGKYQAEYYLEKLNSQISYKYDLRYKEDNSIQNIYFYKNNNDEKELTPLELKVIICNHCEEKKILNSITSKNVVDNIQIKEIKLDENKLKLKQLEEISVCKDDILKYFKDYNNQQSLELLLSNLVINDFSAVTEKVQSNILTQNINRIQELNQLLGIQESQESIIKNAVLEAIYTNLIQKQQTLQCLKVMDLLKESFHHTKSVNNMDLIIFLGGTGAGKSTSINYYLGLDLEEYERYGRKFLRLINEKDLVPESYAKIGQSVAVSETTFIHGYKLANKDKLMLCDCPGFDDTRGDIYDLTTMLSIDQTIKNCHSIKAIVLTLSYETFFVNRSRAVVELFENLQTLIPDIFKDNQIKSSIYMLITKAPDPSEIKENLHQLILDVNKTDTKILNQMEENKESQDNFLKFKIRERIKMWEFVLHLIQKDKIICYSIENTLEVDDQVDMFSKSPCINKQWFCKAMDNQDIQQTFSKYILLQIDTWQNHIFEKFLNDIPKNISEAENWIKQKSRNIQQKKQDIENNQQSIKNKKTEIEKMESQNKRFKELLNSNKQEQIINELKNCAISNDELKDLDEEVKSQRNDKEKKLKAFNKIQNQINLHKKEISDTEEKVKQLNEDISKLSTGNTIRILDEYRQMDKNENMGLVYSDSMLEQQQEAFNSVSDFKLKGEVRNVTVKAGDYTGPLIHMVYIEKDYILVPKDVSQNLRQFYNQEFLSDGRKYKATIEGEHWEFDLGMKAAPDRKKMVYSIKTDWQSGQTIPWFRISHDLPNIDLNEATIINQQAQIDAKKAFIQRKNADINELQKENNNLQEQIDFIDKELKQKEKKLTEGKNEQGVKQIQDQIRDFENCIEESKNQMGQIKNQIKSFEQQIISDQEHINKNQNELLDLQKQMLHYGIIIKCKIEIAHLLRDFATISIDGLGIDQKNIDKNLLPKLMEYSKYYDENAKKILGLCEIAFSNYKKDQNKL